MESDLRNAINDEWRNKDKARQPRFVQERNSGVGADDNGLQYSPALFPTQVAGLVARYSGEAGTYNWDFVGAATCSFQSPCYVNNDAVAGWKDLSGKNNHFNLIDSIVHNGVKIPPTLAVGSQEGLPSVLFNGQQGLFTPTLSIVQPFTVFIVQKLTPPLSTTQGIFGLGSLGRGLLANPGSSAYQMLAGSTASGLIVPDTNIHVLTATFNGASSFFAVDRNTDTLSGSPGVNGISVFGVSSTNVVSGTKGTQNVYEIALYSTAVSSNDQTTLLNYFSGKWGLGI